MDNQNKNLLIATALSFVVILVWFLLFPPPETAVDQATAPATEQTADAPAAVSVPGATPGAAPGTAAPEAAIETVRVPIDTPRLDGSIALTGGRLDVLNLRDYNVTMDPGSPNVQVLDPVGSANPYYAVYGWAPGAGLGPEDVPGPNTEWQLEQGDTLRVDSPVTLRWDSPSGLIFRRTFAVDENFMFRVTQAMENTSDTTLAAAPYGILARHGEPADLKNFFVLHEGAIAMSDGKLEETKYKNIRDLDVVPAEGARAEVMQVAENGWIGFTEHYWMTVLIPDAGTSYRQAVKYNEGRDIYQTEIVLPTQTLEPGASAQVSTRLFSGAKVWETIRDYQEAGVDRFVDSIDWGWFFFLTKPIFWVLHHLHQWIGNMGWSIIALTVILKALLFPLAYKSYVSMAKMKELQPEMEKLKERAGDDRQKMQQEMMALYKREKVNPASGCLPILLQIPIFFSLYKVIFVAFELRHAPWFGPFQDLSAPDPTSLYNLFGLLPWAAPEPASTLALVFIGILPILLGISMWLQQKLNPAPTDPAQAMIFAWMPWVFMFMLGGFASGLVLYWITNNTITFSQQYIIMRSQGFKPDVFGNIKSSFNRKKKAAGKSDSK
ncbi:membrane protein insertase YidC [Salipiger manganoxidans]|uniref:membrane protein insertase YidC n=1 Tax=Salipiger marinus TaxID=555512 RepID=UPI000E8515D6|nr:membrane protein insertase YidC [Salipiger manganoxidans]MCD1618372.1 membrane protein insertase YidC [Salipiger manganoxidans]HBT01018.1 membrane protein insertase YidC [Citreicella sp.]